MLRLEMNWIFTKTMRIAPILFSLLLVSCGVYTPLSPYKMDIRQGNFVTAEMREKIKLGMTRQQVRYVLGTPMISDAFHGNRWDYVYRLERDRKMLEDTRLTLYFEGDTLAQMVEGEKPVEPEAKKTEAKRTEAQ